MGKPYLLWLLVLFALTLVFLPVTGGEPTPRITGAFNGGAAAIQPFTTFYFVTDLFYAVVLYKVISDWPGWAQWVLAIVGTSIGALWGPSRAAIPLAIGSALPCVAYLIAGRSARDLRNHVTRPILAGVVFLTVSAALVLSGPSAPMDIKFGDYGTPVITFLVAVLISFGLVLIMEALFVSAPRWLSEAVTKSALAGFTIVLVHPVFLWSPTPPFGDFVAGVLVPLTIGLLALMTPLSQWVTGQRRLRPSLESCR